MKSFLRHPFLMRAAGMAVLLLLALSVSAQNYGPYKRLSTAKNLSVKDTVAGINLNVYLASPVAQHGTVNVSIIQAGNNNTPVQYQIKYTPDPGYTGTDTFTLEYQYIGTYPYLSYQAYTVFVYPSLLRANADFSTTGTGTPVTVDVLANDIGSAPPLTLSSVPLADHGSAIISNNQLVFTPSPGFIGIAHLNYEVCDSLGSCSTGSLNIGVNDNNAPGDDTLRIATARNTVLHTPLRYPGYTLFQSPTHGALSLPNAHSFRYDPDLNYTGSDQFVLVNNNFSPAAYKTVLMTVLGTPGQNNMAIEDLAFTPVNQPISFNVRSNDIGNLTVKGWVVPSNFPGTISGTTGGGNVTFTPNPGFSGVATFYYKIGNLFIPNLETGTVNIIVGNQEPSRELFDLTTLMGTPLVVNYQIPFTGFNFEIIDSPEHENAISTLALPPKT
ncbi:MAG: hypothetical protein IPL65_22045 [Lewinellaceae bacterium]|nr:hypothetical protein [Lewinellaceae bacterium]